MTSESKKLADEHGVIPFIKLAVQVIVDGEKKGVKGTGQHKVKYISDEKIMGQDYKTRAEREEIKFIFEEDGEQKQYRVPTMGDNGELHYFIKRMSEYDPGDELVLEYKKIPGSFKGFIKILRYGGEEAVNEGEEEVPTVNVGEEDPELKKAVKEAIPDKPKPKKKVVPKTKKKPSKKKMDLNEEAQLASQEDKDGGETDVKDVPFG